MVSRRSSFPRQTPYLVAAIDANHQGRLAVARRLVTLAAERGAHAVKFAVGQHESVAGPLTAAAWRELRREARRHHIDFILAPHDAVSFAQCRPLKPDVYQIDPAALGDRTLLLRIARERRPVLLVAGACTTDTLRGALGPLRSRPVVVLHTVAAEALPPAHARLRYLPWLAARFKRPVGYLAPEPGLGWAFAAVTLGACVIEKSFTLDHSLPGGSHAASLDPVELETLSIGLRDLSAALAPVGDRRVFAEELSHLERSGRSLVARRSLRRGRAIRAEDVESRPSAGGLSPRLAGWLTGRRLRYDVEAGEPITFGLVDFR